MHIFGRDDHYAMLIYDDKIRHTCLIFTCMHVVSTIDSPGNVYCVGNLAIPFLREWICVSLYLACAPIHDMFPPFSSVKVSLHYNL